MDQGSEALGSPVTVYFQRTSSGNLPEQSSSKKKAFSAVVITVKNKAARGTKSKQQPEQEGDIFQKKNSREESSQRAKNTQSKAVTTAPMPKVDRVKATMPTIPIKIKKDPARNIFQKVESKSDLSNSDTSTSNQLSKAKSSVQAASPRGLIKKSGSFNFNPAASEFIPTSRKSSASEFPTSASGGSLSTYSMSPPEPSAFIQRKMDHSPPKALPTFYSGVFGTIFQPTDAELLRLIGIKN